MRRILLPYHHRFKDQTKQYHSRFPLLRTILFILLLTGLQLVSVSLFTPTVMASTGPKPSMQQATFTLDGVTVNVATPFLPGPFTTSLPGDDTQTAIAGTPGVNVHPYGAIYITAVPFGTKPRTEGVPIAQAGGSQTYRASLHQYRVREGHSPQPGPVSILFGQQVRGEASLMKGDPKVAYSSTVVVEWVVEAGKRLWMLRVTEEEPLGTTSLTSAASFLASLSYLKLTSNTLSHATTVTMSRVKSNIINNAVLANYPLASWWNGPCDNNPNDTGGIGTPSGTTSQANWHGIDACYDPQSVPDANITITVNGQNMGGVSEWECVELSMRYMLVAGLINHTYPANGVDIVPKYPGTNMNVIYNVGYTPPAGSDPATFSAVGHAPQAGDVLSYYNPNNVNGHTALVTGSNVNGSGNGTINILQQNSYNPNPGGPPFPTDTLQVSNWQVINDWNATIIGWLDPNSNSNSNSGHIYALAPDKGQVSEYSGSGTTWNKIGDAAGTIFAGNYGVFATNPTSGDIYKYNGSPMNWTDIGQPAGLNQASEYAVTNNGVYASTPQGVFQYSGSGTTWTQVGAPASNIYGGGYGLFATDTGAGNIYKYNGTPNNWTQIGAPGTMFAVTNTGLYGLSSTGVYLYSGSGTNWTQIGVPSVSIYAAGNTIFATDVNTGDIYSYNGSGTNWTQIGTPAANIYGGSGSLLATDLNTGNVLEYMGTPMNWTLIGGPGAMFVSGA